MATAVDVTRWKAQVAASLASLNAVFGEVVDSLAVTVPVPPVVPPVVPPPPLPPPPVIPPVVPPTVPPAPPSDPSVTVTADFITTPHDKIPNFGGRPTITAVRSGLWSDSQVWSQSRPPSDADIVSIPAGIAVVYDLLSPPKLACVSVAGTLSFAGTFDTRLNVTTLVVLPSGALFVDTPTAKTEIVINDAPLTDAGQYSNGLIALGRVTLKGRPLARTHVKVAADPLAGHVSLSLAEPCLDWRVGDRVIVSDTRQLTNSNRPDSTRVVFVSQVERISIASVSADGLTIGLTAPLAFDHNGARDGDGVVTIPATVGNLTRNVVIRSANASGVRGHCFFAHRAEVDVRHVQFSGLGRTTNEKYDNTTYDKAGVVTKIGTNQQGRYSVHLHHLCGPLTAKDYQYRFEGNSVFCPISPMPFRWGITIHDSHYGLVKDNVVFNWAGAGIVAESGNESFNVVERNFVSRVPYSGTGENQRGTGDVAHTGSGVWFAGPNNYVRDNVVNATTKGYTIAPYMAEGHWKVHLPLFPGADTTKTGQFRLVNIQNTPILEFARNEAGGAMQTGLDIWKLGYDGIQVFPDARESVVKDFRVWHVWDFGYYNYMTTRLTFDGLVARNDFSIMRNGLGGGGVALFASDYLATDYTIKNSDIQGFGTGWLLALGNHQTIENSYMRNYLSIRVVPPWGAGTSAEKIPSRRVDIRNVRFDSAGMASRSDLPQGNIFMDGRIYAYSVSLIHKDEVFVTDYNGASGDNFNLYYPEQAADRILSKTVVRADGVITTLEGSPEEGLTNQQNWDKYGIAFAGAVAPDGTTTRAGVLGLVRSI